jgi:hypothetical protein
MQAIFSLSEIDSLLFYVFGFLYPVFSYFDVIIIHFAYQWIEIINHQVQNYHILMIFVLFILSVLFLAF